MTKRDDRWFTTKCGRDVLLDAIHIRPFDAGYLEGEPRRIREQVLDELPRTAKRLLPGTVGLFIEPLTTADDKYPPLVYFCDFTCFSSIHPNADCSSMTAVWFAENLSQPLPEFIALRVGQIDWASHAIDGDW